LLGEHLDVLPAFAVLVVMGQAHPASHKSAHDDRYQGTPHDRSSARTGASDPFGNKDVESGAVCDRADENSENSETASGAVRRVGVQALALRIESSRPGLSRFVANAVPTSVHRRSVSGGSSA